MGIIRRKTEGETETTPPVAFAQEGSVEPNKNKSKYYKKLARKYKDENYDLIKKINELNNKLLKTEKLNKQINLELLQEMEKNAILETEKLKRNHILDKYCYP